jgi:hypothetical protein
MADKKRKIEIFSADCPVCQGAIRQIKDAACPSCEIHVLDMKRPDVQRKAAALGVKTVPAVAVDGELADCCAGRGIDLDVLRAAGLGQAIA